MGEPLGRTLGGLAEFIQGLGNLNDPDKRKRQAVQQAILEDPTKAQEYSQLSPEALQALIGKARTFGSNNSADLIKSIQNTSLTGKRLEEKNKSDAINLANTNIQNSQPQQTLNPFEAYKANQLGTSNSPLNQQSQQNPFESLSQSQNPSTDLLTQNIQTIQNPIPQTLQNTQAEDVRRKSLGLPTQVESDAEAQRLSNEKQSGLNLALSNRASQFNLDEAISKRTKGDAATTHLALTKQTPIQAFDNPNTPNNIREGLMSSPEHSEGIRLALSERSSKASNALGYAQLDFEKRVRAENLDPTIQDRLNVGHAAETFAAKIGVNPATVRRLMVEPGLKDKYANTDVNNPSISTEDKELATAAQAMNEQTGRYSKKLVADIISKGNAAIQSAKEKALKEKASPADVAARMNEASALAYGTHQLTGPTFDYRSYGMFPGGEHKVGGVFSNRSDSYPILNPGSSILGFKAEIPPNSDEANKVAQVQALIDSGQADYNATISDPQAARIKHLLKPSSKKK